MRIYHLVGFILGVGILVILATYFGYTHFYQADVQTLDIHVHVSDYIGMHTGTDALWFGTVSPGSSGKRYLNITNPKAYPVTVDFSVEGDVAGWMKVSENDFMLEPQETKKLSVFVKVPETVSYGNYTGTLHVSFRRG
ncbi:MAG: hypothetical protein ACLFP2_03690 [Candidatus Woesearchaeota archaeon]